MTQLNNPIFRLNNLYKIIDYKGDKVTMSHNSWQKKVLEAFLKHGRVVVLKCRQAGLTSAGAEIATDMFNFIPNSSVLITAHNQLLQKIAFKKCRDMYKDLIRDTWETRKIHDWDKHYLLPDTEYFTTTEMYSDIWSSVRVSLDATGTSNTHWHFTEASRNNNAEQVFISAMSALNEGTAIVESTAWGTTWEGKWFADFWRDSKAGKTWFFPVFIAWFEEERYQKEYKWINFPEYVEEQRQYLSEFPEDIQNEKLQWYYDMSLTQKGKMMQEYPSTDSQAFLSSWNSVFDVNKIHNIISSELYYDWDTIYPRVENEVSEGLRIYRKPTECVISVDPAGWNKNWDYTSIDVYDFDRNLLCSYYWKAWPDKTYWIIRRIEELWYIWMLVPEINARNWGQVFEKLSRGIDDREIQTEMYRRQRKPEDIKKWIPSKYGWDTNSRTRKDIIENLEDLFERERITEIDDRTLHEMLHFYENDNWKKMATDWEHDDGIMSLAICLYVVEHESDSEIYTMSADV